MGTQGKNINRSINVFINGKEVGGSLKELRSAARKLRNEIAGLEPTSAEFVKKSAEFKKVKKRMGEVQEKIKGTGSAMDAIKNQMGPLGSALMNPWTLAIGAVVALGKKVFDFGKELFNLKHEAVGVRNAFKRLGDPSLLERLRIATKGTVSDLELMKSAVQAKNLGLPISQMGMAMEFARRRAKETGSEVNKLVEQMVLGIGRQSVARLDDLGISASRVTAKTEELGSFARGAFAVMNEELAKMGPEIENKAELVDQWETKWENLKLAMAESDVFDTILGGILDNLNRIVTSLEVMGNALTLNFNAIQDMALKDMGITDLLIKKADEKAREVVALSQEEVDAKIRGLEAVMEKDREMMEKTTGDRRLAHKLRAQAAEAELAQIKNYLDDFAKADAEAAEKARKKAEEEAKKKAEAFLREQERLDQKIKELKRAAEAEKLGEDEKEIAQIQNKYQKMIDAAVGHDQQIKELEAIRDEEIALKKEEQAIKREEERAAELERIMAEEEERRMLLAGEDEKEFLQLDAKYEVLLERARKHGEDTKELEDKLNKEKLKIIDDQNKKEEEKRKAALLAQIALKKEIQEELLNIAGDFASAADDITQLVSDNAKDQAQASIIAAGFQLGVDNAKALSSMITGVEAAAVSAGPAYPFVKIGLYAEGLATIASNFARAKRLLNKRVPSFDEGGHTGPGTGTADATGYKVAGVVHQNEWVAPQWMTESPRWANTIQMMEAARQNKVGYAEGGFAGDQGTGASSTAGAAPDQTEMLEMLAALKHRLDNPVPSKALFGTEVVDDIQDYNQALKDIEKETNLARVIPE